MAKTIRCCMCGKIALHHAHGQCLSCYLKSYRSMPRYKVMRQKYDILYTIKVIQFESSQSKKRSS